MTLKELSKLYFRSYKLRVKKSSYVNKKYIYFRSFKGYGDILDEEIRNIDADDLIALQEHLKKRYTNNVATVSYYSVINVFEFAKQIGELKINVAKAVQSLRLNKVATPKSIITEENFYKMLHFINDIDEKIYLELIFVTGLRSAEARALTWENVSFEKSTLKVIQSIYCFTYKNTK